MKTLVVVRVPLTARSADELKAASLAKQCIEDPAFWTPARRAELGPVLGLFVAAVLEEARRGGLAVLVALALAASGCSTLRAAFVEDRSTWSPAMRADVEACDRETVEGRWGWHRVKPDGWTVGFGEARAACLRSRGWAL